MESDYEQRHALAAALGQQDLPPALAGHFLKAAIPDGGAGLDSDYEMAEFLAHVPPAHLRAAGSGAFDALRSIGSDYERKRALAAVAAGPALGDAEVAAIAGLTADMTSDYERAEVLLAVVARQRLSGVGRDAVLAAARRLGSDHERGRVLSAMLDRGALASAER
jgi:hypothetical protein